MMGFMVEIVITAFALGGVLGAVVALHLGSASKQTEDTRSPTSATIELARVEKSAELRLASCGCDFASGDQWEKTPYLKVPGAATHNKRARKYAPFYCAANPAVTLIIGQKT